MHIMCIVMAAQLTPRLTARLSFRSLFSLPALIVILCVSAVLMQRFVPRDGLQERQDCLVLCIQRQIDGGTHTIQLRNRNRKSAANDALRSPSLIRSVVSRLATETGI